jgi:hypothetical protein
MVEPAAESKDEKLPEPSLEERKFLFEQRKHQDEIDAEARNLDLQERELLQKRSDPLMVAVVGGLIAAFASVGVSYYTGRNQIETEKARHDTEMEAEKYKAESSLVSEAVKSTDQVQNTCRLYYLLSFNLVTNDALRTRVNDFLREKKGAETAGTEAAGETNAARSEYTSVCTITTSPVATPQGQPQSGQASPAGDGQKTTTGAPPAKGKLIQSLNYSTGWIGGGHSQGEACAQAVAAYTPQFPGKILESSSASEDVRKDFVGHVTYNYHCVVNVFETASAGQSPN